MLRNFFFRYYLEILILLIYASIYSVISFYNFTNYRNGTYDLGLYADSALQYGDFKLATWRILGFPNKLALSNHFDLSLILLAPVVKVFGSAGLLGVQILAVLFGGFGIRCFLLARYPNNKWAAIIGMLLFFNFYGVFTALSFDFHSIVIASCLAPWFLYYLSISKFGKAFAIMILICMCQENASLIFGFVAMGMAVEYRKNRKIARFSLICSAISIIYFIIIIKYFIPAFSNGEKYFGFTFLQLGKDPLHAIQFVFLHPIKTFQLVFENFSGDNYYDSTKMVTFHALIFAGILFTFYKPSFLIIIVPIVLQKFLNDRAVFWESLAQYNIDFVTLLAIAPVCFFVDVFKNKKLVIIGLVSVLGLTIYGTFNLLENHVPEWSESSYQFYRKEHFQRNLRNSEIRKLRKFIQKNELVSMQSALTSRHIGEFNLTTFPDTVGASKILLVESLNAFPLRYDDLIREIKKLKSDSTFTCMQIGGSYLFSKKNHNPNKNIPTVK